MNNLLNMAIFDWIIRLFKNGFYRHWGGLLEQKCFGSYVYTVSEHVWTYCYIKSWKFEKYSWIHFNFKFLVAPGANNLATIYCKYFLGLATINMYYY